MRLLLVEDDGLLGDSLREALISQGYAVDWIRDGASARSVILQDVYDLVILDRRLPNVLGLELLEYLRSGSREISILMLTACDAVDDIVSGLDAGADEYITKPFDMDELFARIRLLLRRGTHRSPTLEAGNIRMDLTSRQVFFNQNLIDDLTARELSILEDLVAKSRSICDEDSSA